MRTLFVTVLLLASTGLARPKKSTPPPPAQAEPAQQVRGPARLDFTDPRLVQGQLNRAGSVYLYERKELKGRSMVKLREDFREEISLQN